MRRLREEALYLSRTCNDLFVLIAKLVDTENGDDILQLAVFLEHLLHTTCNIVMLLTYDIGLEYTRGGRKRVDSGINALLRYLTREDGSRIKMRERSRRRRVGKVVGRDIDRLNRCDRAVVR